MRSHIQWYLHLAVRTATRSPSTDLSMMGLRCLSRTWTPAMPSSRLSACHPVSFRTASTRRQVRIWCYIRRFCSRLSMPAPDCRAVSPQGTVQLDLENERPSSATIARDSTALQGPWSPDETPANQFAGFRGTYAFFYAQNGFSGFYGKVFVAQIALVVEDSIYAFEQLGSVTWSRLKPGDHTEVKGYLPKDKYLVSQLLSHLQAESLLAPDGRGNIVRTSKGL